MSRMDSSQNKFPTSDPDSLAICEFYIKSKTMFSVDIKNTSYNFYRTVSGGFKLTSGGFLAKGSSVLCGGLYRRATARGTLSTMNHCISECN
jgi:hypothetical protein